MKFGCILKFIAIIIVLLGTSFYIYDKYGSEFLAEKKEELKTEAIAKINEAIENFKREELEDRYQKEVDKLLDELMSKKEQLSDVDFNEITEKFNELIDAQNFDDKKLEDLRKLINSKSEKK